MDFKIYASIVESKVMTPSLISYVILEEHRLQTINRSKPEIMWDVLKCLHPNLQCHHLSTGS